MLHAAPLATSQDLAAFLASYARDARIRLENHDLPGLASLREALETALGMRFEGDKGEHFFRSTLVQTLFYGIFSAWVIWAQQRPRADRTVVFDWKTAGWNIELPVLRTLFGLISARSTLQPLDLVPLIDSACRANAASIAGLMLTTEALVAEIPEEKPAAPSMPGGGGMGDMY